MIVDPVVLARVVGRWDAKGGLFASAWANVVGQWCVDYYNRYEKAPKRAVESLFEAWAEEQGDKELINLVERFLSGLSDEYRRSKKDTNSEYLIDLAGTYFNHVRAVKVMERAQAELDLGKVDEAIRRLETVTRVQMASGSFLDIASANGELDAAFDAKSEPLVTYSGALGEFIGDTFERDGFISFEGPEKRGKTYCLLDVAWTAMTQGRRVAFFEIGDLSRDQIMRRFMIRLCKRPIVMPPASRPIRWPEYIEHPVDEKYAAVTFKDLNFTSPLDKERARAACRKMVERGRGGLLRLSVHAMSTVGVAGIQSMLEDEARDGWVPDVVIVDYADLLAPPPGFFKESRDVVNHNWKALRSLSQKFHCLVVTATQTDADSYDTETISKSNFSEDKRKRAHVTGTIGINQDDKEKMEGVMRWNWVVRRESDFREKECVFIAGCLALARPVIHSTF